MPELKLNPKPTFKAKVEIQVHGEEKPTAVWFTFKHRTRDQLDGWLNTDAPDIDAILDAAEGWDLSEPFNRENVALLDQNYQGAARAILRKYAEELRQAKLGN